MRATTKAHIAAAQSAQEADDRLAGKLSSLLSYIEKEERSRSERDAAMMQAIKEDQTNYFGELRVMRAEISAVMGELRGDQTVVMTEHDAIAEQQPRKLKAVR